MIVAEHKKTGQIVEFTLEQWENLKKTDNHLNFTIIDSSGFVPEGEPIKFSESNELEVDFQIIDYRKLLKEHNVKYNRSIKKPAKLKAIWDRYLDEIKK